MRYTFSSQQRLKSKKIIERLFREGSIVTSPTLCLFLLFDQTVQKSVLQIGFSVPKKNVSKAVDRNRLKRQMREIYRLRLPALKQSLGLNHPSIYLFLLYKSKQQIGFDQLATEVDELLFDTLLNEQYIKT